MNPLPMTRQELRETLRNAVRAGDLEAVEAAMVKFAYSSDQFSPAHVPPKGGQSELIPQLPFIGCEDDFHDNQSSSSTEHKNAKA